MWFTSRKGTVGLLCSEEQLQRFRKNKQRLNEEIFTLNYCISYRNWLQCNMYSENRFLLLCGDLGHFCRISCNNSSDLWQQSYGIGLRMDPTFGPSLSVLTYRLLQNCSWGKDFQCWAAASHCPHTLNNHKTTKNWEWVTAATVLPSVKSWRAFWW